MYRPPPGYGRPSGYGPPPAWGNGASPWAVAPSTIPAWALRLAPEAGDGRSARVPLQPMATVDILDGAIKLLRANFRTIVIVVATFMVPIELVLAFFERDLTTNSSFLQTLRDPTATSSQSNSSSSFAIVALAYVTMWIVVPLVCAGTSRVVMASLLGRDLKAKDALVAAMKHLPAIFVATIIVHVAELVSSFGFAVGVAFVMPLFVMTAPAISLENLGPIAGIRRSFNLASKRYWPTVGVALLSGLLAYFLNLILGLVPGFIALVIGRRWGWLIIGANGILQSFVTVSLITIVATLVFIDARIRQEGFDIEVLGANRQTR